jgi:DNA-binding NarL/FixJ family response regulator
MGGAPMSSDVTRKVIASLQSPKQNNETENLTAREKEVLELLSKGLLYKEIAPQLSISIDTAKSHCSNIYEKLHASNHTEAINKYREQ